tara:strand:- start:223 stop:465 length:243 start_codon:yes stop_codon:yes gene_type:complete
MAKNLDDKVENGQTIEPLIKGDARKYYKKYVAFSSFNDHEIVAYGKNLGRVIRKARKKGHAEPVIVYVTNPDIPWVYVAA